MYEYDDRLGWDWLVVVGWVGSVISWAGLNFLNWAHKHVCAQDMNMTHYTHTLHTHTHTHTHTTHTLHTHTGEPVPERQNQSGFY